MNQSNEVSTRAGRIWALVPLGLLTCMFVGLATLACIAIDDPSFSLEPDYYAKAVNWDRNQAQLRENEALGFGLELHQPIVVASDGQAQVELRLADRAGVAISGARLRVAAFPNAFASRVEQLELHEVAPGIYRATLARGLPGLWELRCDVSVGSSRFARALRIDFKRRAA